MMFNIQKNKCFPLPTYDLDTPNRVKVTLYGQILDKNYTQLLHANGDLDLRIVFLLDKIQKKERISKEDFYDLKKIGLVEGRYPNIFVSYKIADMIGQKTDYVKNKGVDEKVCKELIINALKKMNAASKQELSSILDPALPAVLNKSQKDRKVAYLLQKMKQDGIIDSTEGRRYAKWFLKDSKDKT